MKFTWCLEAHSVRESIFSTMKQAKFKNRNRMTNETLDDSLWLAATKNDIDKGTIVSVKP